MQYQYAGFWLRLIAGIIDIVILAVITFPLLKFIYGVDYWQSDDLVHGFWDLVITYVFPFVATIWFWRAHYGTPGKMALKLKVVDAETGEKLTVLQAVGRYLAYIPSFLFLCLGIFWIGFTSKKQGWHDKLAGTVVVRD